MSRIVGAFMGDIGTLMTLGCMWVIALLFPRKAWQRAANVCARVHLLLRNSNLQVAAASLKSEGIDISERTLARDLLSGNYLENIETMSAYAGYRTDGAIEVTGVEHVRRALSARKGVVLWRAPNCCSSLIENRAYRVAGLTVTQLRRQAHPYSATPLGVAVINPLRTRIEDQYLDSVIWLMPDQEGDAMREMDYALGQNKVLSVTAIGSGRNSIDAPLLGGVLSIARGVPSLAAAKGAAVIPTAVTIRPGPGYLVKFEEPLDVDPALTGTDFEQALVDAYANRLDAHLRVNPASWRGWIMSHTWRMKDVRH